MATVINSGDILTSEQLKESMRIYAGPGAGKTHFLVENVRNIVASSDKILNSNSRKVLCITYTNAAVDEIKSRLDSYNRNVEVYTIHGFIIKYLIIPYQTELFRIMQEDFDIKIQGNKLISSQVEGLGLLTGVDRTDIYDFVEKNSGNKVEYSKTSMSMIQVDIDEYHKTGKAILVKPSKIDINHNKMLKEYIWNKARKLTHNEILYFGYRLAQSNSTICYALRVQFPYIFVDEFQDTNPLQTLLLQLVGKKSSQISVIGDISQSIYSFQGAKPSMFNGFSLSNTIVQDMKIEGNRRSTRNIIRLCNYVRQRDELVQVGVRDYESDEEKNAIESVKVKFLVGSEDKNTKIIEQLITEGGVVLTRAWAAAFEYMNDVSPEQKKILRKLYNSYYISPIDIRAEISEHANVTWVKSFKFIFTLVNSFYSNSVSDIIDAFSYFVDTNKLVKSNGLSIQRLVLTRKLLLKLTSQITKGALVTDVIDSFNSLLQEDEFQEIKRMLTNHQKSDIRTGSFQVTCFNEHDRDDLIKNVCLLEWHTAQMLFEKVFTKNSQYMTVHQAKGLEWEKVVVSLKPTRFDKTTFLDMFLSPSILSENPADEFARMFYVACSRAKNELYIHIDNNNAEVALMKKSLVQYCEKNEYDEFFEFCT